MYYFTNEIIKKSFDALKGNVENKLFGILGILKNIDRDNIKSNVTYKISDINISYWLDYEFYLSDSYKYKTNNNSSYLYIKFSTKWNDYIKDEFIKNYISIYYLIVFIYKFEAFDSKPNHIDLLSKFCKEFHLTDEILSEWFSMEEIDLDFDNIKKSKINCKNNLNIKNDTISFSYPYSVTSRAGELSRAPFIQTLYAGMDSIKCLLILKDNIDLYYKNEKQDFNKVSHEKFQFSNYRNYLTAIKSKPFLLLAGISGTGKSRIVRELARACWDKDSKEYDVQKPINYEMIQVKPNWHDSSELIGYISRISGQPVFIPGEFLKFIVKAWEHPEVPYFLCLDEMNLAPVEQYFAEYLSVIETRKKNNDGKIVTDALIKPEYKNERDEKTNELKPAQWYENLVDTLLAGCSDTNIWALRKQFLTEGISIPQNLIVVGTVNMDETTFSFSRKVLDRAMTIEMNEVDLYSGLTEQHEQIGKLGEKELIGTAVEGVDVYEGYKDVCEKALAYLQAVNNVLNGTPFKIAYRTRNDFLLYVVNNLPYNKDEQGNDLSEDFVIARALDEITSMKILSRIEGDDTKVTNTFLDNLKKTIEEGLKSIYEDFKTEDSVSLLKLKEMKQKLDSGNTSFWS